MRILLTCLPFRGHLNPLIILFNHLNQENHVSFVTYPWKEPQKQTSLIEWAQRVPGHSQSCVEEFNEEIISFKPDIILADIGCQYALETSIAQKTPFCRLGIAALAYEDLFPSAQFTIPKLSFINPGFHNRFFGTLVQHRPNFPAVPPAPENDPRHKILFLTSTLTKGHVYQEYSAETWQGTRLLISNAGWHTAMQALTWGIPIIQLGETEEKHEVGELIQRTGAGLYFPKLSNQQLQQLTQQLWNDKQTKIRAMELAGEIYTLSRLYLFEDFLTELIEDFKKQT